MCACVRACVRVCGFVQYYMCISELAYMFVHIRAYVSRPRIYTCEKRGSTKQSWSLIDPDLVDFNSNGRFNNAIDSNCLTRAVSLSTVINLGLKSTTSFVHFYNCFITFRSKVTPYFCWTIETRQCSPPVFFFHPRACSWGRIMR